MRVVIAALALPVLALSGLTGCDGKPAMRPDQVDVAGKVVFTGGAPVKNVLLNLNPTGDTLPTTMKVEADGKVKGNLIPGTYVYFFSADSGKAAEFKSIPEKYREPNGEHTVVIDGGTEFKITLTK